MRLALFGFGQSVFEGYDDQCDDDGYGLLEGSLTASEQNINVCHCNAEAAQYGGKLSDISYHCFQMKDGIAFSCLSFYFTSHSAYVATETESNGAKIDGLLPPNFMQILKM